MCGRRETKIRGAPRTTYKRAWNGNWTITKKLDKLSNLNGLWKFGRQERPNGLQLDVEGVPKIFNPIIFVWISSDIATYKWGGICV